MATRYLATVVAIATVAFLDNRRSGGAVGHKPQHARAAVAVPTRCLEGVVREGHNPIPAVFPPEAPNDARD